MSRKRPGRPKGSTNINVSVLVEPSRCPNCGSSQRTKYENPVRLDFSGSGLEYVAIILRTTRCVDCGQARRDQEKVYAPAGISLAEDCLPEAANAGFATPFGRCDRGAQLGPLSALNSRGDVADSCRTCPPGGRLNEALMIQPAVTEPAKTEERGPEAERRG